MKTVIEMAREAGWQEDMFGFGIWDSKELNVFAELVRADERDRMCEQFNISKELAHEKAKGNETD